jgi:phosphatidylglycerol:prolipoprotein diacylglycerol transferase
MFVTLTFPNIGPELPFRIPAFDLFGLTLGPFALRWYALAYIVGLLIGWRYCVGSKPPVTVTALRLDDFLVWAIVAVILGGRLGCAVLSARPVPRGRAHDLQLWQGACRSTVAPTASSSR